MTQTQYQFILPSTIEGIAEVEKIVQEICEKFDIPEDLFGNILIALTEAVNNAIYHGNKSAPNKKVTIEFYHNQNQLSFTITDEGNGFDYQNLPDPTLPENITKIGGRGIFIIHQLADHVQFKNNGRTIEITFKIPVLVN
ncbi:MAG: anti-sigma factor [Bacteroidia bacterium]|nr:MAG: anti-sigma factor [Bacteroidia bacterium]